MRSKISRGLSIARKLRSMPSGLHLAGMERQHAVIEAAGERDRHFRHGDFGSPRRALQRKCSIIPRLHYNGPSSVAPKRTSRCASRPSPPRFRDLLSPARPLLLPGVSNALAARVVADLGFPVAYVTGAGIANTFLGIPDNGLVTLTELVEHVAAIRDAFPGPLVVDMPTPASAMRSTC